MKALAAPAKLNLALVVGPRRADGKHEVVTVYERLALADTIHLEPGSAIEVTGFSDDTLVTAALHELAERVGVSPTWRVIIDKRVPVAAGLGGGSSDAAAALRLANATLDEPLHDVELHGIAASIGADVPFFLTAGPQLGEGDGTALTPLTLPRDYHVVLVLVETEVKASTKSVYDAFDDRHGEVGFDRRRADVLDRASRIRTVADLRTLPRNDLAESPLVHELERLGAFRADVSGSGPVVYGLFERVGLARRAATKLAGIGRVWVTAPAWYG